MNNNQGLFDQAVEAARRKDNASARALLKQILTQEPHNLNAWLLASHVVESRSDAIDCLKRVLQLDPKHAYARQRWFKLQGGQSGNAGVQTADAAPPVSHPNPVVAGRLKIEDVWKAPHSDPAPPNEYAISQSRPVLENKEQPLQTPIPRKHTAGFTTNYGAIITGAVAVILCCLVIFGVVTISENGAPFASAQPTPADEHFFNVLYMNARAANEENVEAYMATIHPESPSYGRTASTLRDMFAQYDLEFWFYDLSVTNRKPTEAKIHFSLRTTKIRGPAFRNNIVTGTMILRLDNGVWKIYDQDVDGVQYE